MSVRATIRRYLGLGVAPAVSPAGALDLYYDTVDGALKVSISGAAYTLLVPAAPTFVAGGDTVVAHATVVDVGPYTPAAGYTFIADFTVPNAGATEYYSWSGTQGPLTGLAYKTYKGAAGAMSLEFYQTSGVSRTYRWAIWRVKIT